MNIGIKRIAEDIAKDIIDETVEYLDEDATLEDVEEYAMELVPERTGFTYYHEAWEFVTMDPDFCEEAFISFGMDADSILRSHGLNGLITAMAEYGLWQAVNECVWDDISKARAIEAEA